MITADAARILATERDAWAADSIRYASRLSHRGASLERVREAFVWAAEWTLAAQRWSDIAGRIDAVDRFGDIGMMTADIVIRRHYDVRVAGGLVDVSVVRVRVGDAMRAGCKRTVFLARFLDGAQAWLAAWQLIERRV